MTKAGPDEDGSFRFNPAERAGRARRIAAIAVALILWPVAIALVVLVVKRGQEIGIALVITGGSIVLALPYLGLNVWLRRRRLEAVPPPASDGHRS
jgi:hypothetical protein